MLNSENLVAIIDLETPMTQFPLHWRYFVAVSAISLLGACAQQPMTQTSAAPEPQPLASNPPAQPPGVAAAWRHVNFESNSYAIDAAGQQQVLNVVAYLQNNPGAIATIIGKTDTVGSADYNMRLSHQRADAVRDALVYGGKISADRVETRWVGEAGRQGIPTGDNIAAAPNRVVSIALH
jgi:outer membrane protein OmpA-like peptidoglycan-associated protein